MKGISPLVAAVLLIGVTMAIAGGLAFWVTRFMGERMVAYENQTLQIEKCAALATHSFEILPGSSYNATTETLTLLLENKAGVEFKIVGISIFLKNGTLDTRSLDENMPRVIKVINVGNVSECVSYKIASECPDVFKEGNC